MGRIVLGGLLILAVLLGLKQFSQMQRGGEESADAATAAVSQELVSYISHGEEVDIVATLPAEGYAVVEFTADW